jgi:hypothetical protein
MKRLLLFVAASFATACLAMSMYARAASPFPLQMELRVPFDPTAFPSGGHTFLMYELHFANFSGSPIDLRRIEVLDADGRAGQPLATFEGEQIDALLQSSDAQLSTGKANLRRVNANETLVAFMQVAFETQARVPNRLRHRVVTADNSLEGAVVDTRHTELKVLAPPLRGSAWYASDGPSNDRANHHRRGLFLVDGRLSISRRYATDWFLTKDGTRQKGDAHDKHSYYSYGQPVFAVGSGTIVTARDGMPDNVPGPVETFHTAVPKTLATSAGNMLVLDLGRGQYASYFHLQPGSLRVKTGDYVQSGKLLARVGVSGDSNLPHLHFEIATSPNPLAGEGVPYVIEQYRVKSAGDTWQTVTRELPMRDMLVDFGPPDRVAN